MSMIPEKPSHFCASERSHTGAIPVIGVTGGIGSGKSTVTAALAERGAVVIDADSVGHAVLELPEVRREIIETFGPGVVVTATGSQHGAAAIDRRALGAIVFADAEARRALEAILHPRMRQRFIAAIDAARRDPGGARSIVLDAAILIEAGWHDLCDLIVFVDAPRDERQRRVAGQRGWDEATFQSRERAQLACADKRARADIVISNDGDREWLSVQVDRLLDPIEGLPRATDQESIRPVGSGTVGIPPVVVQRSVSSEVPR